MPDNTPGVDPETDLVLQRATRFPEYKAELQQLAIPDILTAAYSDDDWRAQCSQPGNATLIHAMPRFESTTTEYQSAQTMPDNMTVQDRQPTEFVHYSSIIQSPQFAYLPQFGPPSQIPAYERHDWREGDQPHRAQPQSTGSADYRRLRKDFKMRHKGFFSIGRVFLTLWTAASQASSDDQMSGVAWSQNNWGEWNHTTVRRFIVVKEGEFACVAVPITTYSAQGVAKPGVTKADHCVVYTGRIVPELGPGEQPMPGEAPMQPFAIQVNADQGEKLDPLSRIDFAKPQTIHLYAKAKDVGRVNRDSVHNLISQFRTVVAGAPSATHTFVSSPHTGAASVPRSRDIYQAAYEGLRRQGYNHEEVVQFIERRGSSTSDRPRPGH
ncbi:hypothetical protein LTR37_009088 [Vermiconidia calcicola]|uniref:Uncharacterized protein n=1 Tax=Vermiconidia calcicola TaxID=1690605 RepID=A0ACC3N8Z8_9PEZI|nr:hypothetical protein LTR37_009088 [Vermiconidia calcicola]